MLASLDNHIAIVTGASSGIGKATAAALADLGAEVVMACRSQARGQAALDELMKTPGRKLRLMLFDLADLGSVAAFADEFTRRFGRLDILINNAGMLGRRRALTQDGFEMQFQVNYLGHYLLTRKLLPLLEKAPAGRIVSLCSLAHRWTDLRIDDVNFERGYNRMLAYGHSKLCILLFCRQLAARLKAAGSKVTINAAHPGIVGSDIIVNRKNNALKFISILARAVLLSPKQGAKTSVFLAADDSLDGVSGEYFFRCRPAPSSSASNDPEKAAALWALSESFIRSYL